MCAWHVSDCQTSELIVSGFEVHSRLYIVLFQIKVRRCGT